MKKKILFIEQKIKIGTEEIKKKEVTFKFDDLPQGIYAIQCFQDANRNGKLYANFIGRPTEPWGTSRNVRPLFAGNLNSKKSPLNLIRTLRIFD